jgi:uncharacterized protein
MSRATTAPIPTHDSAQPLPHPTQTSSVATILALPRPSWIGRIGALFGRFRTNNVFFELLERMADCTVHSAEQLQRLSNDFPNLEAATLLRQTRHESGRLVRTCLAQLGRTLLPPFDPQDIHTLVREFDCIVDTANVLAKCMPLYHLSAIEPRFVQQTDVLAAATQAVRDVVFQLRNRRSLADFRDKLIEIHRHESVGDDNHHAALSSLLDGTRDPLDVLKWKELYEYVEAAIDGCEDVGNTLTRLVLKGS